MSQRNQGENLMIDASDPLRHKHLSLLLGAVFTLCLLDRTLTKRSLNQIVRAANQRAMRNAAKLAAKQREPVDHDVIGHVVYHWQRSPNYLDKDGKPFPIPARGPAPSVEALFRKLKVHGKFKTALPQLREFRRVRITRNGLYYPKAEATIIPTLTPEVVESLTQTINRLVATVLHNTSARQKKSNRLIERMALVPDLPQSLLPEFKRFAREQAGSMIEIVNEWLECRRGRSARRPNAPGRIAAGLHAFAFLEKKG
jgi:hypothetical protein